MLNQVQGVVPTDSDDGNADQVGDQEVVLPQVPRQCELLADDRNRIVDPIASLPRALAVEALRQLAAERNRPLAEISARTDDFWLRTFEDTPREEGEIRAGASWMGGRFAARLQGHLLGLVPGKPFTIDNYYSLQKDSVCTRDGLAALAFVTVNDAQPSAEAVAVKDGRIVAVGSSTEILPTRGDDTETIDLDVTGVRRLAVLREATR